MPQPTASQVHVNRPLTNVSIAYLQDQAQFVAGRVFPDVPVDKQSDLYYTYPKGYWYRTEARERAPGTESAGSGYDLETASYSATPKAFHKDVPDQVRANADQGIDVDRDATELVTRNMLLRKELDWAAKYFTTSLWTGSTTGGDITPGTLWNASGSTPIEDIRAQILSVQLKAGGFKPNKVVMGEPVWNVLQDHADFVSRVNGGTTPSEPAIVQQRHFASILGVNEVMVAGAVQNTAQEGATDALSFVFGKDLLIVYAAPRPSLLAPSAGYTFSWNGLFPGGGSNVAISRFRMEHLKSDRVEGEFAYDQKLVASEMGAFMTAVIS